MSQQVYPQINRVVQTESGALRGVPAGIPQYPVFKGVPYAAPPVGNLRWKEPQPVIPWKGVRDAARFGPIAPQHRNFMGTLYGDEFYRSTEPMDEDCLYPLYGKNKRQRLQFFDQNASIIKF